MPPKKKLSKKEKARLEAEQAELLRIEMEKERLKKLEEERQRKQIEREQAKHRQQQEVQENKVRRAQLKNSMVFFDAVQQTTNTIKATEKEQRDWEKFMRCNGLPNGSCPSDLRRYVHQWQSDIERRNKASRNWLLRTDERTLLTQDANVADLTRVTLRQQQGSLGDLYAQRIVEVLGILTELEEGIEDKDLPAHITADLVSLKMEMRIFMNEHLDEFAYKTMSHIERDMEIDRPGVCKHIYTSEVFKSHIWTFSKDAQISTNPKARIGEQNQHNEIDFPIMEMEITLPPTLHLPSSALRGLWLNYDHFSDNCASITLKIPSLEKRNILNQTKREWLKRKEILKNMLNDCSMAPTMPRADQQDAPEGQKPPERSFDIDKLYAEYEDELHKARRCAIGPASLGISETDVNLRKYRIIGGVYGIDYLETPQQDKRLNPRSFIRTITSPDNLKRKTFFQTYKPPPPVQPGVRRLPEEIEAEMRMVEAALDKLALVTLQLPDSVIWFEPPIACRWETQMETFEYALSDDTSTKPPNVDTSTDPTSLSTTTNPSPLKSSPRFPAKMRKRSSQKSAAAMPVHEVTDFDLFSIPSGIDIYGLLKEFVVPRLPYGFSVRLDEAQVQGYARSGKQRVLVVAKHENVNVTCASALKIDPKERQCHKRSINEAYLDLEEPREFFPCVDYERVLKFRGGTGELEYGRVQLDKKKINQKEIPFNGTGEKHGIGEKKNGKDAENIGKGGGKKANGKDNNGNGCNTSSRHSSDKGGYDGEGERTTYMFSELIEDLDRLCELQMPLQEEALKQISANLTSPASTTGTQEATADDAEEQRQATEPPVEAAQSPFAYYSGISFGRDVDAKNGTSHKNTAEDDNDDDNDDEDDDESSAEYDEYDDEEYYGVVQPAETMMENLNSPNNVEAAGSAGGIHDFLSKHSQSGSDSTDGSKSKLSSNSTLTQGKWSTRDVHDTKFNEDKLSIQFRTGRLGIFGFALNRYSNMPYQTWEIKPDFKSFTASIISLDMYISSAGYCVNNFQGGSTVAINEIIGKTLSLAELKAALISSAVDIFPEEDAFCYTEGSCEKNYVMEMHLYACMSTLALSHNFSWSRWNLLAGSRTAVLLLRELQEGKKVPFHSTLLVTPLKTAIIECTEVSASFNAAGIAGMEYYADLYQLSQVHALPSSLEKQCSMDPVLRDNVARILMAIRPLSFC